MKYPVTTALVWAFCLVQIGRISFTVMVYLSLVVLGVHLGLALIPHKKMNLWTVKVTPKKKVSGVAMKPWQ